MVINQDIFRKYKFKIDDNIKITIIRNPFIIFPNIKYYIQNSKVYYF